MIGIRSGGLFASVLLVLTLAGCGGAAKVKVVPAEGIVKIGGKPAANIMIQFLPDTRSGLTGPSSSATTDAEGKFKLIAQDGREGAVLGTHMVMLVDQDEERPPQGQAPKRKPRLDSNYAAPMTSKLTAEVKEGGGPIVIDVPGL